MEWEQGSMEALQRTVRRVWDRVPLTRCRMEQAGVTPEDIRKPEDLRRLPFTTKQDMRDAYPTGLLACDKRELVRYHASSGTTGKPTVVAYTRNDIASWTECMANCLETAGVTADDTFQVILGYGLFTGALGFHYGAEAIGAAVVPTGGGFTERQILLMEDLGTTVLTSTPSYALHLAELIRERNIRERIPLRMVILGGEAWSEAMRERIEKELDVVAIDSYGLSEIIGPGVAMECGCRSGLHLNSRHFLAEIIDPATGEVLPEGEEGELVITTLTKEAMPLVRYRTRDLTRIIPGPCPCGRTGIRLARVKGRSDDMLIIRGVNVYPSQVEALLARIAGLSLNYQLEVTEKDYLKELTVHCESEAALDEEASRNLARFASKKLNEGLGIRVGFNLLAPGTLERSTGKAVRIRKAA
ncbi:MAG: phenylacetate--CoA ligase [Synergistaceae bacterium]|nr:phenylacetate--CoA ligase [Synergistaceae bacterium]